MYNRSSLHRKINQQNIYKYYSTKTNSTQLQENVDISNEPPKFNLMYMIKVFIKHFNQRSFHEKYNDVNVIDFIDSNSPKYMQPLFIFPGFEGRSCYVTPIIENLRRPVYCFQYPYEKSTGNITEIAMKLYPLIKQCSKRDEPINILAHSFGGLVAMDVIRRLELENNDVRLCLTDSSPHAIKTMTSISFGCVYPLEEFENNLIYNFLQCLQVKQTEQLRIAVIKADHWFEKVNLVLPVICNNFSYNEEVVKYIFTATYNTLRSILLYDENPEKLNTPATLIRSAIRNLPFPDDFKISKYFKNPVKELYTDGHHLNMLKFEKTAVMINEAFE